MPDLLVWARNYPRDLLHRWAEPSMGDNPRMKEYVKYFIKPNLFQVERPTGGSCPASGTS